MAELLPTLVTLKSAIPNLSWRVGADNVLRMEAWLTPEEAQLLRDGQRMFADLVPIPPVGKRVRITYLDQPVLGEPEVREGVVTEVDLHRRRCYVSNVDEGKPTDETFGQWVWIEDFNAGSDAIWQAEVLDD